VYMDGDYTYDPKDIPALVQPILRRKCDVVLGSRFKGMLQANSMPVINRLGNVILSIIFDALFLQKLSDIQCGLRALKKSTLKGLSHYKDYGMPYVTEQLAKLIKMGAKIGEVPITYRRRVGRSKLHAWTDGLKILKTILTEFFGDGDAHRRS